ncbi:serine carboxypeptidase S28 family protein (macronuclear) [Tetrahymena thermophila SB210]|uniref:Serine carboxypeptidase S28 family protein n=1 Tax=Tetrahymena thermophila (strain SB210) TaxID=312017 RepID=Q22N04_TETTS|nr:serine carboxypeptidase S28 family protein [Tetrahymena thermophila SB210]EAR86585.1 serine carboxypeptidase S28 family protein [Tetrahymena thermophila SB210]|eukprot:XP_976866.1 serine carboxypeptidase S28 family protein [Tetrahymena thermophila SB210]
MSQAQKLILVFLFVGVALGNISNEAPYSTKIGNQTIEQTTYYFTQKVDHFDPSSTDTYNQRFTVYSEAFNPANGTVFIFIGGEGPQQGLTTGSGWYMLVAQQFSAMVICVEHRFYGVSQPFGQGQDAWTVDHLKFLTVDQSLADLAYFISYIKANNFLRINDRNPFITVGGSYPGAMSAWFRYKYPHLTIGAHASSAVVNAIMDFQQYDYQIYTSTSLSGPECPIKIQKFNEIVEEILTQNGEAAQNLKTLFKAQNLQNDDFLSYFGDLWAGMVQYGKRTVLCDLFAPDTFGEQLKLVVDYAITQGNQPVDGYDTQSLTNTTYVANESGRQWTWQVCTYFGWFQSANQVQPMRSRTVNLQFYQNQCNVAFQNFQNFPKSDLVNTFYGGANLQAFNIVFTNGVEDEWQWASIRYPQGNMDAIISNCTDCGHCVEFRYPKPEDSPQLQQTRASLIQHYTKWITEFRNNQNDNDNSNFIEKMLKVIRK